MSSIINTNILSQIAQNNLNNSQSALTSAVTRLSSGLKINSAADDAAGLAISDRITTQINGLTVAQQNATAGISLAQTAGAALSQITANLQRISELATQASNSSYTNADRQSMNQEVQQRLAEINRIASQTQYNGQNLLDGSFGVGTFQVGANAGQTISVDLSSSVKTSQIGQTSTVTFGMGQGAGANLSSGSFSIQLGNGETYAIANAQQGAEGQTPDSAYAAALAINNADINGLSATATNVQTVSVAASAATSTTLEINGVQITSENAGGTIDVGALAQAIDAATSQTGVSAQAHADGTMTLTAADGRDIVIDDTNNGGVLQTVGTAPANIQNSTLQGSVTLSSSEVIGFSGSDASTLAANSDNASPTGRAVVSAASLGGTTSTSVTINGTVVTTGPNWNATDLANAIDAAHITNVTAMADSSGHLHLESFANAGITISGTGAVATDAGLTGAGTTIYTAATGNTSLANIDVTNVANAQTALQAVQAAISQVDALQSQLGAIQNRFSSTITELQSATQNAQSAQSTIQDADYASEASNLSRAQVLQQAGTAMVAQANQVPQTVLKLLQ